MKKEKAVVTTMKDAMDKGATGTMSRGLVSGAISSDCCGEGDNWLRTLFNITREAVFIIGDVIDECNEQAIELFGYSREEIIGKTPIVFAPEMQSDGVSSANKKNELFAKTFAGEQQTFEWRILKKDGSQIDVTISLSAVVYKGMRRILAVVHDVTAFIVTSNELQEREQQYRAIFDNLEENVIVNDFDGYVVEANPAACRALGYSYDELIGKHVFEYIHEDSIAEFKRFRAEIMSGKRFSGSALGKRKDGSLFNAEVIGTPFRYRGKDCLLGVSRDVTEQLRTEEELKKNELKLALALDAANNGVYEWDVANETITYLIRKADSFKTYVYKLEDWRKEVHPDDTPENIRRRETFLRGETELLQLEYRVRNEVDHSWSWMLSRGKTVEKDANGKPLRVVGFFTDITAIKMADEAVRESEKRLRTIVDQAADEFVLADPHTGEIVDVNTALCRSLGYSREELLAMKLQDIELMLTDVEMIKKTLEAVNPETPVLFNGIHKRKNGSTYPVEVTIGAMNIGDRDFVIGFSRDITERENSRIALEESNRMLTMVLDTIPSRVFWKDTDLTFLGGNQLFAQDAGMVDPRDLIGKTDYDMPWQSEADNYRRDDSEVIVSGIPKTDIEEYQTTPSGSRIWLRTNKFPLRGSDGSIIGILGTYEDITEKKSIQKKLDNARAELERRHNFLEVLLSSIPNPVFFMDSNARYLGCNPSYTEWTGKAVADIIGKTNEEIFPENVKENRTAIFKQSLLKCEKTVREVKIRDKDNVPHDAIFSTGVFRDENGGIAGLVGTFSDISNLKKAEEDLRRSQNMLDSIIKAVPDIIYRLNHDGIITFISDSISDYGYTPEELINTDILDIVHPDDREQARYRLNERRTGIRRTTSFEVRFMRKNKEYVSFEVKTSKLKSDAVFIIDAEGLYSSELHSPDTFIGTQGIARDITERKKLLDQLNQAQKMESVGRLAGGVAHDFNNLLTVIAGNAQIALMQMNEGHPLFDYLSEINKSSERAADLTRQLLTFSRRQVVEPKVLAINDVIHDMEKMLTRLIGEDIEITLSLASDLWPVKMDTGQFQQVITNLAVNARDAMPGGGRLTIETANIVLDESFLKYHAGAETGPFVMIAVDDTGTGMDENVLNHIFEPFFTTKETGKGTGLGLSTCYGIVKQNGGSIWVYSEPGEGTTFKIYLPRAFEKTGESIVDDTDMSAVGGTETILLVEDENGVRNMISRILRLNGYTVIEAKNGVDALEIMGEEPRGINLLLTDVIMPRMGGRDLSERLKASKPDLKTIFMSGYTDNSIVHRGILDDGIEFIGKPFNPEDILRKIRSVLDS